MATTSAICAAFTFTVKLRAKLPQFVLHYITDHIVKCLWLGCRGNRETYHSKRQIVVAIDVLQCDAFFIAMDGEEDGHPLNGSHGITVQPFAKLIDNLPRI